MPVSGIYSIRNKINDKLYIGSSIDILKRFGRHRFCLRKGIHDNIHLQSSWKKYGEDSFDFEIVESSISKNLLEERENFYIAKFEIGNTETNVFNPVKGYNTFWAGRTGWANPKKIKRGKDHPNFGKPSYFKNHTTESKNRISKNCARIKTYVLTDNLENEIIVRNLRKFCRENTLSDSSLEHFKSGKVKKWHNFVAIRRLEVN